MYSVFRHVELYVYIHTYIRVHIHTYLSAALLYLVKIPTKSLRAKKKKKQKFAKKKRNGYDFSDSSSCFTIIRNNFW